MAGTLRWQILFRTPLVTISDFRCRRGRCDHGRDEQSGSDDIVFPRRGVFIKHAGGRAVVADTNQVVFFNRHEPYRIEHPVDGGDDCTVFSFAPSVLDDAWRDSGSRESQGGDRRFNAGTMESDAGTFRAHASLFRATCRGAAAAAAVDEAALALLNRITEFTVARRSPQLRRRLRPDTHRAHRELVHAARAELARRFKTPIGLVELARVTHSSPFHLARIFRRETGTSIHRYVTSLRLRAAALRLADDGGDLTAIAIELGFSSHSHFTESFRRAMGVTPSMWRDAPDRTLVRQMSKNPTV